MNKAILSFFLFVFACVAQAQVKLRLGSDDIVEAGFFAGTGNADRTMAGLNTHSAVGLNANVGGTGFTSYAVGDLLYASSTSALSKLPAPLFAAILSTNGSGVHSWTTDYITGSTSQTILAPKQFDGPSDIGNFRLGGGSSGFTTIQAAAAAGGTLTVPAVTATLAYDGPSFKAYNSGATFSISSGANKWVLNAEDNDSSSTFDSTTNYRWTPNVAGWYYIGGTVHANTGSNGEALMLFLYKNGARLHDLGGGPFASTSLVHLASGGAFVTMNGSSDYIEFYTFTTAGTASGQGASGSTRYSHAYGFFVKP